MKPILVRQLTPLGGARFQAHYSANLENRNAPAGGDAGGKMIRLYLNYLKWWMIGALIAFVVALIKLPLGEALGYTAIGLAIFFFMRR